MKTLIGIFVNNILPVFLVVGTGALLGVTIRPDVKAISRTVFYVLTPCVIFSGLIRSRLTGAETQQVALFAALATLLTAGLAWLVATLFGWRGTRRRALTLPVLSVNAGNFGLECRCLPLGISRPLVIVERRRPFAVARQGGGGRHADGGKHSG